MTTWTPTTYALALREAAETIGLEPGKGGRWRISLAGREVDLPQGRIGKFSKQTRQELAQDGEPYLDLSTGTLSVNRPGLLIHVRLGRPSRGSNRLTPFQCALLARALLYKKERQAELLATAARDLTQPEYARRVSLEWEVSESWLAPVVISRFLEALRREGILIEAEGIARLDELRAYEVLRRDFRLSAIGRATRYPARPEECEPLLQEDLGDRFCRGVSGFFKLETGSWIEPVDYLIDPSAEKIARGALGRPVPESYRGPSVLVRPTRRVPLALMRITPQQSLMNPILAVIEGSRSESPIARQSAEEWWKRWTTST